jgi:AraC-like DNA-binding protein
MKELTSASDMDKIVSQMTNTATIAIAVFGIIVCLTQTQHSAVRRSLAVFLAVVAVNNIPYALARILGPEAIAGFQAIDLTVGLASSLCLAPAFWLYVMVLTSPRAERPANLHRHFALAAMALLLGVVMTAVSPESWEAFYSNAPLAESPISLALVAAIGLLQIATYPQIAIYLVLIIRRLLRYRLMLRDVYASTEKHELRWIYAIAVLGGFFWTVYALLVLADFGIAKGDLPHALDMGANLAGLAIVGTIALWGVRERPALLPDTGIASLPGNAPDGLTYSGDEKYKKSSLSEEAMERIARKLKAAMDVDHLHRDPNLSLWTLARHIGASPNYISQTLNEVIGKSFFDFVNGYRVEEAKALLATTKSSVLTITYEVGFNARSSFYNAFRRVAGETPTNYRKRMSHPAGMDD